MIITKSQPAQELGITRSAISKYCALGMPTRSDGRLDREVALRWVEGNILPTQHPTKGAAVAGRRLERPMPECLRILGVPLTVGGNVVCEAMASTLIGIVQNVPCQMATVAVAVAVGAGAGAPMRVAYALFGAAGYALAAYADREMEKCGVAWSRDEHFFIPLEPEGARSNGRRKGR